MLGLASSAGAGGAGAAGGLGATVFAAIVLVLFEDAPVSFSWASGAAQGWPSPAQREEEEEEEGPAVFSPHWVLEAETE